LRLIAPLGGAQLIRACFGQRDVPLRRGACGDEYDFAGRAGAGSDRRRGKATTFPAGALRVGDAARGQLRARQVCRLFAFDASVAMKISWAIARIASAA
jgi:hypothetical protein